MERARMRPLMNAVLVVALVALAGCAATPNPLVDTPAQVSCCTEVGGNSAGFWLGLWHGIIAPVTFAISFFSAKVGFYELHNNGPWYNAGFLLGMSLIFGGAKGSVTVGRGTDANKTKAKAGPASSPETAATAEPESPPDPPVSGNPGSRAN
jgi:hypothetical protein